MTKVKPKITERDQRIAAEILTAFMFTKDMDEVIEVWKHVYEQFDLCEDPFTRTPCTPKEYYKNQLEYEKQTMIERYGHCDGLE
jgi:hypothetical protein